MNIDLLKKLIKDCYQEVLKETVDQKQLGVPSNKSSAPIKVGDDVVQIHNFLDIPVNVELQHFEGETILVTLRK